MADGTIQRLGPGTASGISRESLLEIGRGSIDSLNKVVVGHPHTLPPGSKSSTHRAWESQLTFGRRVAASLANADCVVCVVSATEPVSWRNSSFWGSEPLARQAGGRRCADDD
ncbi:MAG: hypothetical protein IPH13_21720 [Planctomycetes bacterium]|nr:hypothetical protein [Planctomycetota bacterium]